MKTAFFLTTLMIITSFSSFLGFLFVLFLLFIYNKELIVHSYIRFFLLILLSCFFYITGTTDLIGDSQMYYFNSLNIKNYINSNTEIFLIAIQNSTVYGVLKDSFFFYDQLIGFWGYGQSLFLLILSYFQYNFENLNFDIRMINILLFFASAILVFQLGKHIAAKKISIIVFLFLTYFTVNAFSLFFLKDIIYLFFILLALYIVITSKKIISLHLFYLILTLAVIFLFRITLGFFMAALFFLLLFIKHRGLKELIYFSPLVGFVVYRYSIINKIITKIMLTHIGHFNTGGYCYRFFDKEYFLLNQVPETFNYYTLILKSIYFCLFEPNPYVYYNKNYLLYQIFHLYWIILLILAVIGFFYLLSSKRFDNNYLVLIFYLISTIIILGLSGGNVGTLIRHRIMIEPVILIFSGIGISIFIPFLKIKKSIKERYETH